MEGLTFRQTIDEGLWNEFPCSAHAYTERRTELLHLGLGMRRKGNQQVGRKAGPIYMIKQLN